MPHDEGLSNRLKQLRGSLTQEQFAKKLGVSRSRVSNAELGRDGLGGNYLATIAKAYPTLNIRWLLTGSGEMFLPLQLGRRRPHAPLVWETTGKVGAGYCVDAQEEFERPVSPGFSPLKEGRVYFVCEVLGESMSPLVHDGDRILFEAFDGVEPERLSWLRHRIVVVNLRDGATGQRNSTLKVLKPNREAAGGWILAPLNPDMPARELGEFDRVIGAFVSLLPKNPYPSGFSEIMREGIARLQRERIAEEREAGEQAALVTVEAEGEDGHRGTEAERDAKAEKAPRGKGGKGKAGK